jgi:hypothetical protein
MKTLAYGSRLNSECDIINLTINKHGLRHYLNENK